MANTHITEINETVVQSFNSIGHCLIATLQPDVDEAYLRQLGGDISNALEAGDYRSLIIDATPLELIDASDFERLRRVIKTVGLMGVDTVIVGLKPGVVASLVELNTNVDGLVTTLNMEKALAMAGQSELLP